MRGEFSTIVDFDTLRAATKGGELPDEIPVLPKGEFMTLPYGNMVLNDDIFNQMIGNFKGGVRRAVPLDFDHAWENTKAGGWIKELFIKDDGLWAKLKYNKLGKEAVEEEIYKMISAEWSFDYVDPQKSTHHGAVLVAATLTNRPLMQSMPTITASENKDLTNGTGIVILLNSDTNIKKTTNMPTIAEILKKPVADRSEEDIKFLEEHKEDFTEEQTKQLEDEVAEVEKAEKEEREKVEKEKAEAEGEADEAAEKGDKEATEKALQKAGRTADEAKVEAEKMIASHKDTVTIKASELEKYKKMEADHQAAEQIKVATDFASPFMASEKGGKVAPAGKENLVKLAQSLNEEQKKLLASVLNATADQKIAGAIGEDDKAGKTVTAQYNDLVNKYRKEGKSASEANTLIRKKHKDVYEAFTKENK